MKKISLLFFCALAANSLFGQANVNYTNATFEVVKKINQGVSQTDLSEIKGSAYFSENFYPGKVSKGAQTSDQVYFLRYNGYNDEIEMADAATALSATEALVKNKNIACQFNGESYLYLIYNDKEGKQNEGYLIPQHLGKVYKVYTRKYKKLTEGREAKTSLEQDIPPRFVDQEETLLQMGDNAPQVIKIKYKNILALLSGEALTKATAEKGKFKKMKNVDELVALVKQIE